MEIVSELLGYSSISITEDCYEKVVKKKVSEQMRKLVKKNLEKEVGILTNNLMQGCQLLFLQYKPNLKQIVTTICLYLRFYERII